MKCHYMFISAIKKNLPLALFLLCGLSLTNCKVNTSDAGDNPGAISVLMVGGGSSHDFDRWYKGADAQTLREEGLATVRYTSHTDSIAHYLPGVDVLYLVNNQPISDPAVRKAIFDFVAAGKGVVLGHAALWYNWSDWPEYNNQLVSGGSRNHDRYGTFEVTITEPDHAITKGIPSSFTLKDELYHFKPDPSGSGITVLATASVPGSDTRYPSVFVVRHNTGRIAGLALGHDGESHNLPAYKDLLRNAVRWAAGKQDLNLK
jgi:type 1 glutamine amidotransferase